ncbi:hypothetical protein NP493_765g00020 [Ridgeia piscesae]|uniref:Uncharacterized protein n=1 Tax=Ridgeia piscesae TaxID=27915 RepID=A0AAD9KNU1_RIDPI|nr:hypothetical protein NP493_765g00020 [Ridgeia piscesae]
MESSQKTNVLEYEYDYFTIYSSTSTITLECDFHGIPRCHCCSVVVSLMF